MVFFLIFLCLCIAVTAKIEPAETFNKEYMSPRNTKGLKGLFVVLVIFTHFVQYVTLESVWDAPYLALRTHLNQMVVAPFLFYSGYGIMKSIQNKGNVYVSNIIKKRFPKVWFDFAVAVALFLIVNNILGKKYPLRQILLAFTGWESIGNSNWYIFGILSLYLLTYLSFAFSIIKKKELAEIIGAGLLTMFTMLEVWILMRVGKPNWFYNTLMLYVLGIWYALIHEKIERFLMKSDFRYLLTFTVVLYGYCWLYLNRWNYGIEGYTLWAMAFVALFVMITMKFSFKSTILSWFGERVFSVYILQRIPMIVLSHLGVAGKNRYIFLILSIFSTMVLSILYENIVQILYERLIGWKRKFLLNMH